MGQREGLLLLKNAVAWEFWLQTINHSTWLLSKESWRNTAQVRSTRPLMVKAPCRSFTITKNSQITALSTVELTIISQSLTMLCPLRMGKKSHKRLGKRNTKDSLTRISSFACQQASTKKRVSSLGRTWYRNSTTKHTLPRHPNWQDKWALADTKANSSKSRKGHYSM